MLVTPGPGDPIGVPTGIILNSVDIAATHTQLQSGGVDVDAEVAREGATAEIRIGAAQLVDPDPPMFYVRDPDGNAVLIVQPG